MVEEARVRQPADAEQRGAEEEGAALIHVPGPSLWPAALGLGVALLLFGVLTHWAFSLVGAALFVAALGKWIAQIRRESLEGSPEHDAHT